MFQRVIKNDPLDLVITLFAVTGTLLLFSEHSVIGVAMWAIAYIALVALSWYRLRDQRSGSLRFSVAPLLVLVFAASPPLTMDAITDATPAWISMGIVLVACTALPMIETIAGYVGVRVANVPGISVLRPLPALKPILQVTLLAAPPLLFLFGRLRLPGWTWLLIALPVALIVAAVYIVAVVRRRVSKAARAALPGALRDLAPDFVVYWDAPLSTAFQLAMWLPYLKRVGRPFFVMLRNRTSWDEAVAVCGDIPTVLAPEMIDVDEFTVPTLRAAFYTNNAARNTHYVRFQDMVHVQLLHGESDKAPSYNPVTGMFDRIYVAGQAGKDRYAAHGVYIDDRKFEIVGRPQVENVQRASLPIAAKSPPVVLYAPTWRGLYLDSSYCSLGYAEQIVEELLERGCAVVFRPHPWSYKTVEHRTINMRVQQRLSAHAVATGTPHVFGDDAERTMTINDCFNASDAMIADVSSVIGDYLHSLKPIATTAFGRDPDDFVREFPLAEAGYLIHGPRESWTESLDALLGADPKRQRREDMHTYYLGTFPEDDYASGFVNAVRRELDNATPIGVAMANSDDPSD